MRVRSKSANIYNVIVDGRVIKTFKYEKAAERFAKTLSLAEDSLLEIETIPVIPEPPTATSVPQGWEATS